MEKRRFEIPALFEALNGCLQHYNITLTSPDIDETKKMNEADKEKARENLNRLLEFVRFHCGQPVITSVNDKELDFVVEQAETVEDEPTKAEETLTALLKAVSTADDATGVTKFVVDTITVGPAFSNEEI